MSKRERISIINGKGLLTEVDLSLLLDLSVDMIIKYIDKGKLPGTRIGPQGSRRRTLTSVNDLILFVEQKTSLKSKT